MMKYNFDEFDSLFNQLKNKLKIAVVHGGNKEEPGAVIYKTFNPRSWKSYEVVAGDIRDALMETGFRHVEIFPDDLTLLHNLKAAGTDLVWLNTAGVQGYIPTSHTAAMLEMAGIPYVGHNPQNAGILDNKHIFKFMLQNFFLPTSPFVLYPSSSQDANGASLERGIQRIFGGYEGPFIVKPVSGRASLHVHYCSSREDMVDSVHEVYEATRNLVIVERYFSGREFCVSICGGVTHRDGSFQNSGKPFPFSIIERKLGDDEPVFTSMDKKPITTDRLRVLDPSSEGDIIDELSVLARRIYQSFFLETLVRIDFRMDRAGKIHILETNPKPDLKRPNDRVTSLTCMGLSDYNMSYTDLITGILADRLDYLFRSRISSIGHIVKLLD